ncbi:MAG: hypothetical protein Q8N44_04615, partial [Rubrivivax sp.]|nr:hypothetical protein [Rubrivivax sp.]
LAGALLAGLIGASRIVVGAHSVADVALGLLLGYAGAGLAWQMGARQALAPPPAPVWLAAGLAVWLLVMPVNAPVSRTHHWVTLWSLGLSGHAQPYTREQMQRAWQERPRQRSNAVL